MSSVSAWLLSITCMILLSVLAEFVLPEGQINKYTKVIFSFVMLLVIIMPLPKLFGKDFNLSKYFNNNTTLQEDYLYQLNIDKLTALNEGLYQRLEEIGLRKVEISINADVLKEKLEIHSIYVDLRDIEYMDKFGSKDITRAKMKINEVLAEYSILRDVEVKYDE